MKKYAVTVGLILVVVLVSSLVACGGSSAGSGGVAQGAGGSAPRVVTATGEAEVRVVPDEVVITLGAETEDTQLSVAKAGNDAIVERVLERLQGFGIAADHIQTEYIGIRPTYDYSASGRQRLTGYNVQKTIVVTLSDLSRFEELLSGVLESGANYVHNVEFKTTELRKYRDQARALAVTAAQEKAAALADTLDQQVGEPVTITEEQNSWQSWYGYGWGSGWSGTPSQNVVVESGSSTLEPGATVAPGQITVNARVSVTFALK
jgi:uncharacterized protein